MLFRAESAWCWLIHRPSCRFRSVPGSGQNWHNKFNLGRLLNRLLFNQNSDANDRLVLFVSRGFPFLPKRGTTSTSDLSWLSEIISPAISLFERVALFKRYKPVFGSGKIPFCVRFAGSRLSLVDYIIASNIGKELIGNLVPRKSFSCEWMGRRHDSKDQTNVDNNVTCTENWMSEIKY